LRQARASGTATSSLRGRGDTTTGEAARAARAWPVTAQRGLVQATPAEAAALLAACSLPSTVLTAQDLVPIAHQLASVRTGMRAEDLRYQQEASARYEYIRQTETAAVMRVRADLRKAGWSTISRENAPGWGADLSAWRRQGSAVITRAVEVKGKGGPSLASVVLQRCQYERARRSAAARDQEWWLVQCAKVLDPSRLCRLSGPLSGSHGSGRPTASADCRSALDRCGVHMAHLGGTSGRRGRRAFSSLQDPRLYPLGSRGATGWASGRTRSGRPGLPRLPRLPTPVLTTLAYRLRRAGRPGRHRSVLGRPVSQGHIQTVLHERRDRSLLARHHRQAALRLIQHVADVCEVEHPALPELGEQVVIGQAAQAQLASTDRAIAGTSTRTRWSASLPSSGRKRRRLAIRWTPTMVSRATAPVA